MVSFLPDGRLLYADEEQLYALDIETRATEVIAPFGYSSNGASAVDAAGTRQALGGCGQLNLFEVGQDTPHSILLQDDTCLKQVVFSTDGQQVAALLASGAMYLVSEDGSVRPLEAGGQPNNASWRSVPLRFSPDGQSLAWVAAPWALHLYHTADGTLEQTLRSPGASITAVHFENSAEGLVVLDEGDQVSLAQITLEERVASWEGDTSYWINGYQPRAGFSADGSLVWLRHGLGCTVRETETGRLYGDGLPCGEKTAISPNGDRLAVSYDPVNSGDPARVLVYHTRTGARLHTLRFQAYLLRSLQFSPDGQLLLAVEDDGGSFLWAGGRRVFPWVSDLGWRTVFAPDGLGLVSGSRIVDLSSGAVSSLPQGQQSQVAVSPDGRLMARRAEDGTIELWDVVQVKLLHRLSSLPGWKALLAFSADGSRLLLVQDGVMAFWGVK
jgi:WD40 repeat protein